MSYKKIFVRFLIIIGVFLLTGCNSKNDYLTPNNDAKSVTNNDVELIPNSYYAYSKGQCTSFNELYFKDNDYTYYKICIDYIEFDFENTKLIRKLDDSILSGETSLDDLINNSNEKIDYRLYEVYLFNNFNLAIKDKDIYLIYETINYKNYLDSLEN